MPHPAARWQTPVTDNRKTAAAAVQPLHRQEGATETGDAGKEMGLAAQLLDVLAGSGSAGPRAQLRRANHSQRTPQHVQRLWHHQCQLRHGGHHSQTVVCALRPQTRSDTGLQVIRRSDAGNDRGLMALRAQQQTY